MKTSISLFLLASAALHLAVLGLVDFSSPTQIIDSGSLIRVSIQAPSSKPVTKTSSHKNIEQATPTKKLVSSNSMPVIKPVLKKQKSVNSSLENTHFTPDLVEAPIQKTVTATEDTTVAKHTNDNPNIPSLSKSVSSLLYSDLKRAFDLHFYYPRMAIKRGWEGEVKISLRVEANGYLTHIQVIDSSGYNLLDKAAITSIDRVQILPAAIALLDGRSLDLILPVQYGLL